jgi:colanic acid/amylovoran biosynthesis glycosyltransferase
VLADPVKYGRPSDGTRPPVSVVVPFRGPPHDARDLFEALKELRIEADDEITVVENHDKGHLAALDSGYIRVVSAADHFSSYYARNVGAEASRNEWLLFLDADCRPGADLLDSYFEPEPAPDCGALAGEIVGCGEGLLARWAISRGLLRTEVNLAHPYRPSAVTANVMVRAQAWREIGGFQEGIRSGGDGDFAWRLQDAGWKLDHRSGAVVQHVHRERIRAFTRQLARHSAGAAWLNRRHPGSSPRPKLVKGLVRCAAGIAVWTISGRFERARLKGVDAIAITAGSWGYLQSNAAPRPPATQESGHRTIVIADAFPRLSETFVLNEVLALRRKGLDVRVEAIARPDRPLRGGCRGLSVSYREDDAITDRIRDGLWLAARHPLRAYRDARSQRRWRAGGDAVTRLPSTALPARRAVAHRDVHLHAHFGASAALEAMRLSRLLGLPYSVAPHAFEIFARPTNLVEKLTGACFISTDCDYNVKHLRGLLPSAVAGRVHEVVLGIDETRFSRTRPLPGTKVVGAVGRLVEKKGFEYLIEAVGRLERDNREVDALLLAGDGPLRSDLERLASDLGVEQRVRFLGSLEPDEVLDLLQVVDVFALPCVIAEDGDRDSMPVVVKEAMAMELMVVGSDVVGLPEMIRPEWGRLVPPSDPSSLADAIDDLLSLPSATRVKMGADARAFVLEHCNVDVEAAKVASLIKSGCS